MLSKPVLCNFILSIEMATRTDRCMLDTISHRWFRNMHGSAGSQCYASLAACDISEEPPPALLPSSTASGTEASEGVLDSGHATTTVRIGCFSERMDPDGMGPDIQSSSWSAMTSIY